MNKIGYEFKDKSLLNTALTHQSYANETGTESYERLEFLGDSVLQIVVSEYLYEKFPDKSSGELSKFRSHLVSTKNLSRLSKGLHLDTACKFGRAVKVVSDGVEADLFESVLGAIYLDGGMEPAKDFIFKNVIVSLENVVEVIENDYDYKTALQEKLQALKTRPTLNYELVSSEQKDNSTSFTIALVIDGKKIRECTENSKKLCEKKLSKFAIENFDKIITE
mgnify:CR=1 FL=1